MYVKDIYSKTDKLKKRCGLVKITSVKKVVKSKEMAVMV